MVEVPVYDAEGKEKEKLSFDEAVFGEKVKTRTLREVVLAYEANRRQGTNNNKNLSEVAGSGRKPWKQKGTGRARAGQKRAPQRHKGSVAHGPHPRSYRVRVPAKMKRVALESALLAKFRAGRVAVVEGLTFEQPKTRRFAGLLANAGMDKGTLLVGLENGSEDGHRNFVLSARNVPGSLVMPIGQFNAYDVMKQRRILLTREAFEALKGGVDGLRTKAEQAAEATETKEPEAAAE
jgi:large subunit ribosomal protein L4